MRPLWPLAELPPDQETMRRYIEAVVASGNLTMGDRVREFEAAFARLVGSRYAVMVNSGSSANLLAMAALRYHPRWPLRRGDEAIVPAIAWPTTYAPLEQHGLRLRVVDVDPDTLNASIVEVRKAWTKHTRLLVGVSILGHPAALDEMLELAKLRDVWFLEDNCESLGASVAGRQAGTFGNIGTFSTFFSHHLSTVEGGMLVTDDPLLRDLAVCLRAHGWARDLPGNSRLLERTVPQTDDFPSAYRFLLPGYNLRPTEIQAAIGLSQLATLTAAQQVRRQNAWLFNELKLPHFHKQQSQNPNATAVAVPYGFVLIAKSEAHRYVALKALSGVGIEHRAVTGGCFTEHEAARHYAYRVIGGLPNARRVHRCGFFVGNLARDLRAHMDLLETTLNSL